MQNFLKKYKSDHKFSKETQILLINHAGSLEASCDSLFSTKNIKQSSLLAWSPFFESIFPHLISKLNPNQATIFKGIQTDLKVLPGFYDYSFRNLKIDKIPLILWTITDKTILYKAKQIRQQNHHNRRLSNE